jgi:hypothetical protein
MYIAIPTYNRSDILERKTLTTLLQGGINPSQIYIFVANEQEKKKYEDVIPSTMYHKIIIGKKGIANQRIFIKHYFKEGDYVVSIDDDVEGLFKLSGDKLVHMKQAKTFFEHALEELKKEKKYMWGIYPVRNPFFMKKKTFKECETSFQVILEMLLEFKPVIVKIKLPIVRVIRGKKTVKPGLSAIVLNKPSPNTMR